ncbi:core-2/I-Branching enzyme [Dyadobacter jejuensis]|uniref:Peptide O-xylosyltransferase n=1 Tax=Dyadobacter jejuensis TaxID=1082580 RepID=A0A316AS75_9BACT|nr:beta-1,6-N-acetylglucosaminyltransferase [Dyadobacter jejuensis]PWJ60462.1 core-2/I-Branching enzyme [Dyadobacter jejuensis]
MINYRVAYLLMVHKNSKQVRRLIERLDAKQAQFWIQVDLKVDLATFQRELEHMPQVHFVQNRKSGAWGRFGFVEGNLEGIRSIARSGYAYDHLVILSGQDYLLSSNEAILTLLAGNPLASFMHYTPVADTPDAHVAERMRKYHIYVPFNKKVVYPYDSPTPVKKLLNGALALSGQFPLPRTLPGERPIFFGSNWVRLSKKAVNYLLDTLEREPELIRFFRYTTLAEEHIFQTILLSGSEADRGEIINTNFTFCHWKRAPELYTVPLGMSDLDLILGSGDLLARKFDMSHNVELMDYLDRNCS